jgi:hypothetical protein
MAAQTHLTDRIRSACRVIETSGMRGQFADGQPVTNDNQLTQRNEILLFYSNYFISSSYIQTSFNHISMKTCNFFFFFAFPLIFPINEINI